MKKMISWLCGDYVPDDKRKPKTNPVYTSADDIGIMAIVLSTWMAAVVMIAFVCVVVSG